MMFRFKSEDFCRGCEFYNEEADDTKNWIRCVFGCEDYIRLANAKAYAYNKAVSGDDFETEVIYEHGHKVYGSGSK